MPGERRFDSIGAKAPPTRGSYELHVDVDLVEKPLGLTVVAKRTLSWSGRVSDALAFGESLKAGRQVGVCVRPRPFYSKHQTESYRECRRAVHVSRPSESGCSCLMAARQERVASRTNRNRRTIICPALERVR